MRILIVDDEPAIIGMLKLLLESESFDVETAYSAAQALVSLRQRQFDIVLTDMRMETATAGFDVAKAAQQLQPRPAVAILTAFPIPAAQWRLSGADALLIKGSDLMALPETLRSLRKVQAQKASTSERSPCGSRRWG